MVVGCRRKASSYLQLLFDAQRLGSMEMKAGLWGCEEERTMSHMKAVCWSWRDVPTNVQVRCMRVAHLGSKGRRMDDGSAWSHPPVVIQEL